MKYLFQDTGMINEDIMHARSVMKAFKQEKECIPLPSCLFLQYKRSQYILKLWQNEPYILDNAYPEDFGYEKGETGEYEAKINDLNDEYFCVPQRILKGCYCKKCTDKCQCRLDENRGFRCSKYTCKNCSCVNQISG